MGRKPQCPSVPIPWAAGAARETGGEENWAGGVVALAYRGTDVPSLTRVLAEIAALAPGVPGAAFLSFPVPMAGALVCFSPHLNTRGGNRGYNLPASLSLPVLAALARGALSHEANSPTSQPPV